MLHTQSNLSAGERARESEYGRDELRKASEALEP